MKIHPFIAGIVLTCGLIFVWPMFTTDARTPAERWLYSVFTVQDHLVDQTQSYELTSQPGRLLVISGSNALFGFDGHLLEDKLDRPVINLSSHAGFSFDFHLNRVLPMIQPGDWVLAPLELELYHIRPLSNWRHEQNLIWMETHYPQGSMIDEFSRRWSASSEVMSSIAVTRLLAGRRDLVNMDDSQIVTNWEEGWGNLDANTNRIYHYLSLDKWGFIYLPEELSGRGLDHALNEGTYPRAPKGEELDETIRALRQFQKAVEDRGGRFLLTWPNLMDTQGTGEFGVNRGDVGEWLSMAEAFQSENLTFICDMNHSLLRPTAFSNSRYHLNAWGSTQRSWQLIDCLAEEGLIELDDLGVAETQTEWERVLDSRISRGGALMNWEQRLVDLKALSIALEDYFQDHGAYPVSSRWSGVTSNFGPSGPDWIPGLAPDYIVALPRDPAHAERDNGDYLYRSNGADYKLISISRDDIDEISQMASDRIDPRRADSSFGFWSAGSQEW